MTVDRSHQEKRDFIRMRIDSPLTADIRGPGIALTGLCHELSGGGMQLSTDRPLEPGTELEVTVSSEHGQNPTLRATAQVVRSEPEGKGYRTGLEILEILQ